MALERLSDIDWPDVTAGPHHRSPCSWADQVLYFFLVDRFSDGNEDGVRDAAGVPSVGSTDLYSPADNGNAIGTESAAVEWRDARKTWVGGNLQGAIGKLGYLKRLGVTALWVSPVLRQRKNADDYHGYGIQNFLEVDPHFGTAADLRTLVARAHDHGLYVILDVVLNHAGDVFGYDPDRYEKRDSSGAITLDPRWDDNPYRVAGWRDANGNPALDFDQPVTDPDAGVWPSELQTRATFTARGRIDNWNYPPEFLQGDFIAYKDVHHGSESNGRYVASEALKTLIRAYSYWIAYADLDGFRIDTVKHMDPDATRIFVSSIKEFAQSIGKDNFFQVGEITGGQQFAIDMTRATGLDAALGLDGVQDGIERVVKGEVPPGTFFDLFSDSADLAIASHTWFAPHVVTSYDDHDQVRKNQDDPGKSRFAFGPVGGRLAAAAIALNVNTLGIPCIYYGSEQTFDGEGHGHYADGYIREAMFGGEFGAFRSKHKHFFDESHPVYQETAAVLAVRNAEPALRRGRQYLRPLSEDGQVFRVPEKIGDGRIASLIAWSRILSDREVVVVINTDLQRARTAWVTVDNALHSAGDAYRYLYSTDAATIGTITPVEALNGKAILVTLPPCGIAILGVTP